MTKRKLKTSTQVQKRKKLILSPKDEQTEQVESESEIEDDQGSETSADNGAIIKVPDAIDNDDNDDDNSDDNDDSNSDDGDDDDDNKDVDEDDYDSDVGRDDSGEDADVDLQHKRNKYAAVEAQAVAVKYGRQATGNDGDRTGIYKPPTSEELNQLRETQNLFHSTLFRLQISEILNEVKVKNKRFLFIENAVDLVKSIVLSIEPMEKYDLQDHSWLKECKVKLPIENKPDTLKGKFKFDPPEEVFVTGSFPVRTCIKQNLNLDIALKMPKKFFNPKDHLNHRYTRKRALYLCKVASVLANHPQIDDVKFTYHHGNHLRPIVLCTVKGDAGRPVKVHLHAVPESGVFTLNKFVVSKNNVRSGWFQGDETLDIPPENDVPTPFYNSSLLEDILAADDTLAERLEGYPNGVKEGIILLKIWLRQRELDMGFGGFSGHIMTLFVVYLLSKRKLNQQMSSYQIMRNTLVKLKDADWTTDGITLCHKTDDCNMPLLTEFHKHFDVVFVDHSGYLNVCYAMNTSTFNRVRQEASLAVNMLDDKSIDSFDRLFMKSVPFYNKFDHIFHVHEESSFESCVDKFGLRPAQYLDYGRNAMYTCLPSMLQVLVKGLGQRVKLIQSQQKDSPEWSITKKPQEQDKKLTFGLLLDSEFAFNVLDRGPSADQPEAQDFRKFWGEKSDLRRFQDGGICEAVLWANNKKSNTKEMVCKKIVRHILDRHCGIKSSLEAPTVQYLGDQLNSVLLSMTTNDENSAHLMNVYDDLCKILRKLDDLPLTIASIQGVSPCFRFTEVFSPPPCTFKYKAKKVTTNKVQRFVPTESSNCPVYIPSLKVVCMMETSGKWPDDIEAMKRLKGAFLIQMAEMIKTRYNLPVRMSASHLDVLKDNYVFRLVLAYTKEINLLRTIKSPDGMIMKRDTVDALSLEKEIVNLPKLTSTLYGIQNTHNSFTSTVRLAKRWICSHMLGDYIQPEAIELIVVYLYLSPPPYTPPKTGFVGFQRFLELLSTYDWKMTPMIVDLNNDFTEEDLQEVSTQFTDNRSSLPLMFISTPQNKLSSHWTATSPSAPILHRLVLLAQTSLKAMHYQINNERTVDMKQIFRPPLDLYDVLFDLNMDLVAQPYHQVDVSSQVRLSLGPVQNTSSEKIQEYFPITDFNPVKLLMKEIRESFDDICMVFHDEYGGSVIGLVWKPDAFQTKEFKISAVNHTQLQLQDGQKPSLAQNIDSIIEDIRLMSGDLIQNVRYKGQ